MTVIAVENIMKRLQKGLEDKMRQLSEAREKMNDGGESISHYLLELEKKVIHQHSMLYMYVCVCVSSTGFVLGGALCKGMSCHMVVT